MGRAVYLLDACVLIDVSQAGGPGFLTAAAKSIYAVRVRKRAEVLAVRQ